MAPGSQGAPDPGRAAVAAPAPSSASPSPALRAAYCDIDGTLSRTDIVGPLLFFKRRLLPPFARALWLAALPPRGLGWWLLDKCNRGASNRAIYRCYAGLEAARVRTLAEACYRAYFQPRLFCAGLARLARLKEEGVQLVLVSGSLDFLVQPLARETGAELVAAKLEERDGCFTGRLLGAPLTGELKAAAVRRHAAERGVDLAQSFAFGDALGDAPMLACVGRPVAVNPGRRLKALAQRRGWAAESWL